MNMMLDHVFVGARCKRFAQFCYPMTCGTQETKRCAWHDRDIGKLRHRCIRKHGEGAGQRDMHRHADSEKNLLRLAESLQQHRLDGLKPQSKRPQTIHRRPAQLVDEVKEVRLKTAWCPHKIAGYLRTQGRPVGHMTVYCILRTSALNQPLTKPRIKRTYKHEQRTHPNSLWQWDLKLFCLEHTRFQLHKKFIEYYDYERSHMSLNFKRLAEVYFGDVPYFLR